MLHRRKAICITGNKDYTIDRFCGAEICHIEANAHIDPLLLKSRKKLCLFQRKTPERRKIFGGNFRICYELEATGRLLEATTVEFYDWPIHHY